MADTTITTSQLLLMVLPNDPEREAIMRLISTPTDTNDQSVFTVVGRAGAQEVVVFYTKNIELGLCMSNFIKRSFDALLKIGYGFREIDSLVAHYNSIVLSKSSPEEARNRTSKHSVHYPTSMLDKNNSGEFYDLVDRLENSVDEQNINDVVLRFMNSTGIMTTTSRFLELVLNTFIFTHITSEINLQPTN